MKKIILLILLVGLAVIQFTCAANENQPIELSLSSRSRIALNSLTLSPEDWQWIKNKQILTLGSSSPNYPPFDLAYGSLDYSGINADYLGILAYNLNVKVRIMHYENYEQLIAALEHGDIDLIANASDYEKQQPNLLLSTPYLASMPAIVERTEGYIKPENDKIVVAITQAYNHKDHPAKIIPDADYVVTESPRRSLEALSFKKIDAFICDATSAQYIINQANLNNLVIRVLPEVESQGFSFAAERKNERLINMINKVLEVIPEDAHVDIQRRWSGGIPMFFDTEYLRFTSLEHKWLKDNSVIRVAANTDYPPISFLNEDGRYQGMTADILETVSFRTGLKFEIIYSGSLMGAIEQIQQNKADIVIGATLDALWDKQLLTTHAYLLNSWVYVGRKGDVAASKNFDRIAMVNGHSLDDYLEKRYPQSKILYADSPLDGLAMVNNHSVDALILPMVNAELLVNQYYRDKLTLMRTLSTEQARFIIGVSQTDYPLATILDKALQSILPEDLHVMTNSWYTNVSTPLPNVLQNKSELYGSILFAASILLLLCNLFWYLFSRSLKFANREQKIKQQALLDAIPIPIYVTDFKQKITQANRSFLDALVTQHQDATQRTLSDYNLTFPHEPKLTLQRSEKSTDDYTTLFIKRVLTLESGSHAISQWNKLYCTNPKQAYGYVGGWIDVTEREHMIQELQQTKEEADRANRTKTTFLATMSHEIRTPMNAIIGLLELVIQRKNQNKSEPDWQSLEAAYDSAYSLLALIGDILDIAKIESDRLLLHPERAELRQLIESTAAIFDSQARQKGLDFKLDIDSKASGHVLIDPLRFKQILSNLLSNAIKFTDNGRVILRILTEYSAVDSVVLAITVIDTGQGIDAETRRRLFQPFSQGESNKRSAGSGLGLYICQTLVDMMAGTLTLTSQVGIGTEVLINLTLPRLADVKALTSTSSPQKIVNYVMDILIVEDHQAGRMLLSQQLIHLGQKVTSVDNGQQALEQYQKQSFDLIITDCNMPLMDGYTLTSLIRKQEKQDGLQPLTIWGLTADAQTDARIRCIEAGMDDCLFKPLGLAMLERKIYQLQKSLAKEVNMIEQQPGSLFIPELLPEVLSTNELRYQFLQLMIDNLKNDAEALKQLAAQESTRGNDIKSLAHRISGGVKLLKISSFIDACQMLEQQPEDIELVQKVYSLSMQLADELSFYNAKDSKENI